MHAGASSSQAQPSRFGDVVIPWGGLGGITLFADRGSFAHSWLGLKEYMQVWRAGRQAGRQAGRLDCQSWLGLNR